MWQCLRTSVLSSIIYLITISTCQAVQVAVAANFAKPMQALINAYPHKDVNISVSFGSTGQLLTQIEHGAPFDVFLAADQASPRLSIEKGLAVTDSQFTYAQGRLALWGPAWANGLDEQSLSQSLISKFAMANPKIAPYGLAAQQCQQYYSGQQLGVVFAQAQAIVAQNVGQSYQFTSSGNVDVGFVALSQLIADSQTSNYWILPEQCYQPILQDAVLLTRAQDNPQALEFLRYLQSDAARTLIQNYGYHVTADHQREGQ